MKMRLLGLGRIATFAAVLVGTALASFWLGGQHQLARSNFVDKGAKVLLRASHFLAALVLVALHCPLNAQVPDASGLPGKAQVLRTELQKMKRQMRSLPPSDKKHEMEALLAEIERRIAKRENPSIRFVDLHASESSNIETQEYVSRLKARIEDCGSTHFPTDGKRSVHGRVVIEIHIDRDGALKSTELFSSSKKDLIDQHAVRIVRSSAPFGKVPDALAGDRYKEFVFSAAFDFRHDNASPYVSKLPVQERCKWADDETSASGVGTQATSSSASGSIMGSERATQDSDPTTRHSENRPPVYPLEARRYGQQGRVVVRVLIDVDGRASQAVVRESSGHPLLDKAAVDAVISWSYIPGKRNGNPEAMEFNVPINFVLQ